ncbi:unnamed protein product, partial [Cladocopium goreaui]
MRRSIVAVSAAVLAGSAILVAASATVAMSSLETGAKFRWRSSSKKWCNMFLVSDGQPELGSWLDVKQQPWGVDCKVCKETGVSNPFASYSMTKKGQLQNCNLMKHHKSKAHKAAVKEWLKEGGCVGPSPDAALSLSQFQELMECFGEKRSLTQKELQMAWCLAEGLKALDQTFIAKSSHISLMRDERHGRLAIRFMAVAPDLTTRSGFLGATWVFQLTQAAAAASATEAWLLRPNRLAVSASKGFEKTDSWLFRPPWLPWAFVSELCKKRAAVSAWNITSQTGSVLEPVCYHSPPYELCDELIHDFFAKIIIDLTPLDGRMAWAALRNRHHRLLALLEKEMTNPESSLFSSAYSEAVGGSGHAPQEEGEEENDEDEEDDVWDPLGDDDDDDEEDNGDKTLRAPRLRCSSRSPHQPCNGQAANWRLGYKAVLALVAATGWWSVGRCRVSFEAFPAGGDVPAPHGMVVNDLTAWYEVSGFLAPVLLNILFWTSAVAVWSCMQANGWLPPVHENVAAASHQAALDYEPQNWHRAVALVLELHRTAFTAIANRVLATAVVHRFPATRQRGDLIHPDVAPMELQWYLPRRLVPLLQTTHVTGR